MVKDSKVSYDRGNMWGVWTLANRPRRMGGGGVKKRAKVGVATNTNAGEMGKLPLTCVWHRHNTLDPLLSLTQIEWGQPTPTSLHPLSALFLCLFLCPSLPPFDYFHAHHYPLLFLFGFTIIPAFQIWAKPNLFVNSRNMCTHTSKCCRLFLVNQAEGKKLYSVFI